ncbi:hypothetical protein E1B28_011211 [Marasmius oreades]|uniref:SHSP domain-containing protein n=1 Tax=Marasmius oreades TaxID=181124 RepID=A0A9P7UPQ9_9AGAR|nr:uncharacterized protein E1B28_011211 [Marasmius oreades]KAG7089538.1 hypothetical protein E1B28_011211 [Marasmius oreades]
MPTPPSMSRRPTTSKLSPTDKRMAQETDPNTPNTPTRITVPGTSELGNYRDEQERLPPVVELSPSNSRSLSHDMVESSLVDESIPLAEGSDLDDLWATIRQKKEKKVAKEQPKVQSLREPQEGEEEFSQLDVPAPEIPRESPKPDSSQKRVRKQKSFTSFRESADGRELVAFIDVQGCEKQDVHVSYQRNRLVVSWFFVECTEWEEDGCIVRERVINNFQRAFPLPEGTRFKEIRCAMNGRHLVLKYPNSRSFRVENVAYDSRGSVRS